MASVLSQASGRSWNSARMAAAGLNQCSGVTRRRSRSAMVRPSAMHSSASCASCISGFAKYTSLAATMGSCARCASASSPASMAGSCGRPWRCSSTASRSGKASRSASRMRAAASRRPSPISRATGPSVPPVSRNSPWACWRSRSSVMAGRPEGSSRRKPCEESRWRLSSPAASMASATSGSGGWRAASGRSGSASARVRNSRQPMMGWMPFFAQASANSSAPNMLALSVSATAGIPLSSASAASFSALMAPSLSE